MDLYADLPLAKGAKASSALDADGKPKTALSSTNSVWASAPLMVPQAAKNKNSNRPTSMTISSTSMLPSALAAGRGKSPTLPAISLAFKPASVTRRTAAATQKKTEEEKVRPMGSGLGYVAATERKKEDVAAGANSAGGHFFQATYRDEYHPARPNSYEVYCKERLEKKKLDEVKRELSRRQREQEREGKLEREKLAKDLAEGRAPAMKLPAPAGRGRGMTMPAWMRKKMFVFNMVGPGEVDDELQDEVKGECAETYGPVTKCMIYEVAERVPPEEAVRIFVQFRNAGDATKGRKVQAVYYDEGKFERMNLTSQ
uniref:RRM domain-containing protein n=1 Tax=Phytophthora ramorum TaxID=164328 RepID=H3HEF3_PHYRM